MENVILERPAPDRQGVALKAFTRIADAWSLTLGGRGAGGTRSFGSPGAEEA